MISEVEGCRDSCRTDHCHKTALNKLIIQAYFEVMRWMQGCFSLLGSPPCLWRPRPLQGGTMPSPEMDPSLQPTRPFGPLCKANSNANAPCVNMFY